MVETRLLYKFRILKFLDLNVQSETSAIHFQYSNSNKNFSHAKCKISDDFEINHELLIAKTENISLAEQILQFSMSKLFRKKK